MCTLSACVSRTQLTREVLEAAKKLVGIGCFCIGTNQVDLIAAQEKGMVVFNAPYSNTRSVAELVLGRGDFVAARHPREKRRSAPGWLVEIGRQRV